MGRDSVYFWWYGKYAGKKLTADFQPISHLIETWCLDLSFVPEQTELAAEKLGALKLQLYFKDNFRCQFTVQGPISLFDINGIGEYGIYYYQIISIDRAFEIIQQVAKYTSWYDSEDVLFLE